MTGFREPIGLKHDCPDHRARISGFSPPIMYPRPDRGFINLESMNDFSHILHGGRIGTVVAPARHMS